MDISATNYSVGSSNKQRILDEMVSQEVALLRTKIGFLMKKVAAIRAEKVSTIGS